MNIVFLHGSNDVYGASRVLFGDAELLAAEGHCVTVVLPFEGPLSSLLSSLGATVVVDTSLFVLRRSRFRRLGSPVLPPAARTADVVVLWTLAMSAYGPLLRALRRKYVVSVHERVAGGTGKALLKLAIGKRTPTQVNSRWTGDWVAQCVGPHATSLAYPVLGPPLVVKRSQRRQDAIHAVVLGRVNGRKGHLLGIDLARQVQAAGFRMTVTLAGAPFPGQEYHLRLLSDAVEKCDFARYVGEVRDVPTFMAREDPDLLLVLSEGDESFGLTPLDAWRCGVPSAGVVKAGAAESLALVGGLPLTGRLSEMVRDITTLFNYSKWRTVDPRPPGLDVCTLDQRAESWRRLLGSCVT